MRIESQWGKNFLYPTRVALRPTQPPVECELGLPRWKCSWGMLMTSQTLLTPRLWMGWSYTSASLLCLHKHVMLWLLSSERVLLLCYTVLSCTWILSLKRATILTFLPKMILKMVVFSPFLLGHRQDSLPHVPFLGLWLIFTPCTPLQISYIYT